MGNSAAGCDISLREIVVSDLSSEPERRDAVARLLGLMCAPDQSDLQESFAARISSVHLAAVRSSIFDDVGADFSIADPGVLALELDEKTVHARNGGDDVAWSLASDTEIDRRGRAAPSAMRNAYHYAEAALRVATNRESYALKLRLTKGVIKNFVEKEEQDEDHERKASAIDDAWKKYGPVVHLIMTFGWLVQWISQTRNLEWSEAQFAVIEHLVEEDLEGYLVLSEAVRRLMISTRLDPYKGGPEQGEQLVDPERSVRIRADGAVVNFEHEVNVRRLPEFPPLTDDELITWTSFGHTYPHEH